MSEAKRLQNEQQFLISECKRHIESNKLNLWGFKAEQNTLASQYKKLKLKLENQENQYFLLQKEVAGYTKEMKTVEENLGKCSFDMLAGTLNPYPIIQDIATAICIQIGSQTPSWRSFRKLIKDQKFLLEALKSFNPVCITTEQMKYFSVLYKKHNLILTVKDSKLPEEFLYLAEWFLNSYLFTLKDQESKNLCNKVVELQKEAAKMYVYIQEVNENVKDCEFKLEKLINCIEKAEKNITNLNNFEGKEFESIKRNCEKIENTVKKSSFPDGLTGESAGPSILVESLFIQGANSFNFEELIEKSESKALISMDDMESSFPKEAPHSISRILPQQKRKNSKKKRCCGFG